MLSHSSTSESVRSPSLFFLVREAAAVVAVEGFFSGGDVVLADSSACVPCFLFRVAFTSGFREFMVAAAILLAGSVTAAATALAGVESKTFGSHCAMCALQFLLCATGMPLCTRKFCRSTPG